MASIADAIGDRAVDDRAGRDSLDALLKRAIEFHDTHHLGAAAQIYRRLIANAPRDINALRLLGRIARQLGNVERGILLARRAIAAVGPLADLVTDLGVAYLACGRPDLARSIWRLAAASEPCHCDTHDQLAIADLVARRPAEAWCRLRRIAAVGGTFVEGRNFKRELELVTGTRPAVGRTRDGPRYLMIRPWVCGFWGEVNHVAVQLVMAEAIDRVPFVFWGPEIRYRAPDRLNAWDAFFEPVSAVSLSELEDMSFSFFPARWNAGNLRLHGQNHMVGTGPRDGISSLYLLNSEADVVVADGFNDMRRIQAWLPSHHPLRALSTSDLYRRVFQRCIRIKSVHWRRVDAIAAQLFSARPVLAVHYRAQTSPKQQEAMEQRAISDEDYFAEIDRFLHAEPDGAVFMLSDFAPAVERFRERYGERLLTIPAIRLTSIAGEELGLDSAHDGYRLGLEVLTDAMLACRAEAFLGDGASGVSCGVAFLKDWAPDRITLLRRNVFMERCW